MTFLIWPSWIGQLARRQCDVQLQMSRLTVTSTAAFTQRQTDGPRSGWAAYISDHVICWRHFLFDISLFTTLVVTYTRLIRVEHLWLVFCAWKLPCRPTSARNPTKDETVRETADTEWDEVDTETTWRQRQQPTSIDLDAALHYIRHRCGDRRRGRLPVNRALVRSVIVRRPSGGRSAAARHWRVGTAYWRRYAACRQETRKSRTSAGQQVPAVRTPSTLNRCRWFTGKVPDHITWLMKSTRLTLRRARLVLGWVTVSFISVCDQPLRSTQPGIPSWVGAVSTSQRAVTPCGWGVKAGVVRVWVADKTVWYHCYTRPISERFRDKELIYKALYKFSCLLFNGW